ncbi:NUDIX hydrolase [Paenibacillus mesophilus]|uniref:NUDIX hydrolase n=1 Tax=Paenibacillus mesophilus TaxID=2582849 RepID=UPI00110E943E|nr:NUDIX hydrolase [Paenibacillus mesophilus]TMV44995.1 NUDIX hydrolase [Paenibacillus mesophilus]
MGYIEELRAVVGHRPLILVGAVVVIMDERNRILLQQRVHPRGKWAFPGGLMELGESAEDTARREVLEETGLEVGELRLIDVFSGPQSFMTAPNGDEFYAVTIAYSTREVHGDMVIDLSESMDFRYFPLTELPEEIVGSHKMILDRFLSQLP